MKKSLLRYLTLLLMLISGFSLSWATDPVTDTFAATGFSPALPTNYQTSASNFTCTSSGNVYSICNAKWNNTCLFISNGGGYVESTQSKVVKEIKFTTPGTSIARAAVVNLYVNGAKKSSWSSMSGNTTYSYSVPASDQAANTTFKFQASSGNCQILSITYVYDDTDPGTGGNTGGGETSSGTDTLTKDNFVASGSSYKEVSYTSPTTGVVYTGKTNAGQQYIQINATSGWIYANSKDNKVAKSITFTPNSNSQNEAVLVYGSNSELSGTPTTAHTGLVQLLSTSGTTSGTFDLKDSDDNYYKYILVYANKWVRYNAVAFTWEEAGSGTPTQTTGVISGCPTELTLTAEDEGTINASVNSGATLSFTSGNDNVIMVDNDGNYMAIGAGTTTITVSAPAKDNYTAPEPVVIPVTVNAKTAVITVDPTSLTLIEGATGTITASVNSGATLSFSSDNQNVIVVENDGSYLAGDAGTATITISAPATSAYTAASVEIPVTVTSDGWLKYTDALYSADGETWNAVADLTGDPVSNFKYIKWEGCPIMLKYESGVQPSLQSGNLAWLSKALFSVYTTDPNVVAITGFAMDPAGTTASNIGTWADGVWTAPDGVNVRSFNVVNAATGSGSQIKPTKFKFEYTTGSAVIPAEPENYVTDHLTSASFDATTTSQKGFTGADTNKDSNIKSTAVYAGKTGKGSNDEVYLNQSGFGTTASGGKVRKVALNWAGGSAIDRVISVYGSNEAITNVSEMTPIATIAFANAQTEAVITDDYAHIYIAGDGSTSALLGYIDITWEPAAPAAQAPVFKIGETVVTEDMTVRKGSEVTITSENAELIGYQLTVGEETIEDAIEPGESVTINADCTLKAWGVNADNEDGEYTQYSFTMLKPVADITFNPASGASITKGGYVTISCADAEQISYILNSDAEVTKDVDENHSIQVQLNTVGDAMLLATALISGAEGSSGMAEYTVTETTPAVDRVFKLISSKDELVYGKNYIIVNAKTGSAQAVNNTAITSGNSTLGSTNVTVSNDNTVTVPSDSEVGIFTLETGYTGENYSLKYNPSGPYLGVTAGGSTSGFGSNANKVNNTTFTISFEDADKWAKMTANGRWMLSFTSTSNVVTFRTYNTDQTQSSFKKVYLYVEYSATEPGKATFSKTGALIGEGDAKDNDAVTVTSQNATHIKYTINGGTTETVEATDGVATLPAIEQNCTIEAWGFNSATNEEGAHETATFTVVYAPTDADLPTFSKQGGSNLPYNSKVTITGVAGCTLEVSTDDVNYETVTSPYTYTLKSNVTLYARSRNAAGVTEVVSYYFDVQDPETMTFRLVTEDSQIVADNQYLIVNGKGAGTYQAITSTQNATGKHLAGENITVAEVSDNILITLTEDEWDKYAIFTLRESATSENKYALQYPAGEDEDEGMYLAFGAGPDTFVSKATNNDDVAVSIGIEDVETTKWSKISGGSNNKYIRWNTSNNQFRIYNNNTGNPVYLYELADLSKVMTPSLKVTTGTADAGGYYNNGITLKASCSTKDATIKYSTDYSESNPSAATWQTVPADPWTLNEPCNIVLKAEKEGLDDSDVSSQMQFKFRPAAPVITVADGLSVSKKVTVTPSTTEGAVTEVQNGDGTWQEITAPMTIVVTENGAVNARATKTGYNPNTVTTSYNVEVTYDGTEENTHTYDTCTGGATSLTKPWNSNNSYSNINGVEWYLNAENGADVYLGTNYGQIGKASDKEDGIWAISDVVVTTDQIPGVINKVILYVSGTNDTEGGTYTVKIGGNVYGTGSYGTSSNAIEVNGGLAEGPVELIFHNTNPGAFNFSRVQIDYTPVADLTKVRTPRISLPSGEYTIDTEVEITCGTPGARIYYTTDGTVPTEASTQYTGRIVLEDDITLTARAFKSGLEPSNVASAVYTVIEADIYELITAGTKLEEGDEIIVVNNIPMTSETVKSGQSGTLNWTDPAWFAMGYEKYVDSKGTVKDYYTGIPLQEVTNGDPDRPRQLMATSDMKIARFTLAPLPNGESSGANNNKWLLQCGTTEIDDPENPGEKITVPTYVESVVKIVQSGGKNKEVYTLNFVPLPDNAVDRTRLKATLSVMSTTTENEKDFAIYHQNGSQYNCSNTDKDNVYDKGIITFSGVNNNEVFTTTFRFNPTTAYHFNGYGYTATETGNDLHDSTWPVSFYRSTDRLYRPSITVYSQKVTMENYNEPTEYETKPLGEDVYPFYNAVKVVVKEHPRTQRGAILAYHWAKTEDDVPVAEEYDEIEGSEVKGADMTVYVDGFDMLYYDVDNVEYRLPNYFSDENLSNSDDFMEAVLFSISELEGVNSPNTHRKFKFKTTAPDIEKTTVDGQKGIYIKRPEVFTKGAVIYYTTNGVTEPEVTWTYNEGEKKWEASPANANVRGPWTPGAFMEIADGQTVKVGAFKHGYEPAIATVSNLTVMPYARPIQLLELSADGLAQIKDGSSETTKAEIDGLKSGEQVYLTYRPASVDDNDNPKYYVLQNYITIVDNKEKEVITIIDVNNDAAKAVINNPHLFKWTADYYVFGMRLDEFVSQLNGGSYDETTARMYVHDGSHEARVIPTEFNLNEDDEFADPQPVTYYGSILRRKGSLGTNYLWTEFKYDAKEAGAADYTHYETSRVTQVTPEIPAPFELRYHYESVRDESSLYDREDDYVFVDDTYSSIPGIVTAMKNGAMEKNTLKFRKEDFTLRHLDCVFTFHRPNVCDDIIDNYDIVYDVEVKTGNDLPNLRAKYVDPTKAADIKKIEADALAEAQAAGKTLTKEQIHDIVNRYEFRVNNVHPATDIFPTLVIHGVNYYPNGENEGYSELNANYTGDESEAMDEFYGVVDLDGKTVQEVQAPNLSSAAEMTVDVEVAYDLEKDEFGGVTGKYNWEIANHKEVRNGDVHAHNYTPVVAPFMYHIEGAYFEKKNNVENENDVENENVTPEKYFSYEYLICHEAGTDPEGCGTQGVEGEDPFFKIPVGKGYEAGTVPTIFITPMYFFERMPEPSVTEESALVEYDIHYADNNKTNAPKKVMRRAGETDADNPDADQPQIIVVRGKNAYSLRAEKSVMTGIDGMGAEGIVQQGNNLILPQGAKLYDTSGLQMRPEGLPHGIYLVRLADGRTVKVAVK